jgi:PAS domain S-box-containing protein
MRCQTPASEDSTKNSGVRGPNHPAKIADSIFKSLDDLPKRSSAMYLVNPAPWNIARTRPQWPHFFIDDETGERIPFDSHMNVAIDAEEADHELHQARDNFAAIFNASPAIICIIQLNGLQCREINKAYEQLTGYGRSEVIGNTSLKLGLWSNAEDRKRTIHKLLANGRLRGHREVFQTKTGQPLTTSLSAEIIEFGSEPCALVIAEDITVRRQAEQARMDLAQLMINAQEAERTRVARELHDNIGQSLALFSMELERTRLLLPDLSPASDARLVRLCGKLKGLSREVGSLSHQLHSSELELLGLAVAVKALCREFSEQYQIQAHSKCSGIPDSLSTDVSLCLFRVVQEALHNTAKHSRAKEIVVEVRGTSNSLSLFISDNGVGFDPNASKARVGLGMVSMRERIHLVGGKFTITSKPGSGTRIEANIPITNTTRTTVFLESEALLREAICPELGVSRS